MTASHKRKRLSPLKEEQKNLIESKKNAYAKWEECFECLLKGDKIPHQFIAQIMDECNMVDVALRMRGLK